MTKKEQNDGSWHNSKKAIQRNMLYSIGSILGVLVSVAVGVVMLVSTTSSTTSSRTQQQQQEHKIHNSRRLQEEQQQQYSLAKNRKIKVISSLVDNVSSTTNNKDNNNRLLDPIIKKQHELISKSSHVEHHIVTYTTKEQYEFLDKIIVNNNNNNESFLNKNTIFDKYNEFTSKKETRHFAIELWKYCTMYFDDSSDEKGGGGGIMYIDPDSPVISSTNVAATGASTFIDYLLLSSLSSSSSLPNIAVLSSPTAGSNNVIHGSLLLLSNTSTRKFISKEIIKLLIETPIQILEFSNPLLIQQTLYKLILQDQKQQQDDNNDKKHQKEQQQNLNFGRTYSNNWIILKHKCFNNIINGNNNYNVKQTRQQQESPTLSATRTVQSCPQNINPYCCHIYDINESTQIEQTIQISKHPFLPYQVLSDSILESSKPYNSNNDGNGDGDGDGDGDSNDNLDLAFMSTISEKVISSNKDNTKKTPNFYNFLKKADCLPKSKECSTCLRNKKGADCDKCKDECRAYCKKLCHYKIPEKRTSKEIYVTVPPYKKDSSRLIPRIIHQTWFEALDEEKYPNMVRLHQSFKKHGRDWKYKFWLDDDARQFLIQHFPKEVLEAYDELRPGAFKADLFRYCVLLIYGGVYADMDVMLESNLDFVVTNDVGFMVPHDEPGRQVDKGMCLWNGFIASAPGHPFLVKVIEVVVNNIRNKFTSVDYDAMFCPNPELSILHAYDTLFTAGPCILGASINWVLGKHGQTQFNAGEIKQLPPTTATTATSADSIPGRTIILQQNKWDMGAHRFTLLEKNVVVAATDMPDYDDREKIGSGDDTSDNNKEEGGDDNGKKLEHYSKTHVKVGIYGVEMLYHNFDNKANEKIVIKLK